MGRSDEALAGDDRSLHRLVCRRIRELLDDRGMSPTRLAGRAGMTQATMSRSLAGRRVFDLAELQRLAAVLKVDPAQLLAPPGDDQPGPLR